MAYETVEIDLDIDTYDKLKRISEISEVDLNSVVNVILALYMVNHGE